jgi:hypothetical protein
MGMKKFIQINKAHTMAARSLDVVTVAVFIILLNLSTTAKKNYKLYCLKIQCYDKIILKNQLFENTSRHNFEEFITIMKSTDIFEKK